MYVHNSVAHYSIQFSSHTHIHTLSLSFSLSLTSIQLSFKNQTFGRPKKIKKEGIKILGSTFFFLQTKTWFSSSSCGSNSLNLSEAEGMMFGYLGICAEKLCLFCARVRAFIPPFLSSLFSWNSNGQKYLTHLQKLDQIDQPRWEDLPLDCLVIVFGRVGMRSLLLNVPFVCKSWHRASLDPSCWQRLIFIDTETEMDLETRQFWCCDNEIEADIDIESDRRCFEALMSRFACQYRMDDSSFSDTGFIKFIVNRSRGRATFLRLPGVCPEAAMKYVGDVCHGLKGLSLPRRLLLCSPSIVAELIGKCKHLELLSVGGSHNFEEILLQFSMGCCKNFLNMDVPAALRNREGNKNVPDIIPNVSFLSSYNFEEIFSQIRIHCKNFCGLNVSGALIRREDVLAIVNLLPHIKYLILRKSFIDRDDLATLLQGCEELVLLDARNCCGFDEGDVEISVLASHIGKFSCEGSRYVDPLLWLRSHKYI